MPLLEGYVSIWPQKKSSNIISCIKAGGGCPKFKKSEKDLRVGLHKINAF